MTLLTTRWGLLVAMIVGVVKLAQHMQTGAVLAIEGCGGRVFEMALGESPMHCWGCYLLVGSAVLMALTFLFPHRRALYRVL